MVREANTHDLENLVKLAIEHAKDSGQAGHDDVDRIKMKQEFKQMIISPDVNIIVAETAGQLVGYAIGAVQEKLWNGTLYGELLFIFIHPEVRNKLLLDDMVYMVEDWFMLYGCQFMQASVMTYDSTYQANDEYNNRARNYFQRNNMAEVGYHFVKKLGRDEWAE